MRRARVFAAISLVGASSAFACGTVLEAPPVETAPADASLDAATTDATPVVDGGAAAPCVGAYLCDGFERTAPIDQGWDTTYPARNGSMELSTERHRTGERALRIETTADDPKAFGSRQVFLRRTMAAARLTVSFAVFVSATPSQATGVVNVILADNRRVFVNYQANGGFKVFEQRLPSDAGAGATPGKDVGTIAVGTWRTVKLDLDVAATDATKQRATVTVDDEPPVALDLTLGDTQPIAEVDVGAVYSGISSMNDVFFFDDVVMRTQ